MSHTLKIWERVLADSLGKITAIHLDQYGFMSGKSTTDAIQALRIITGKCCTNKTKFHAVFVVLEKAYDRIPR